MAASTSTDRSVVGQLDVFPQNGEPAISANATHLDGAPESPQGGTFLRVLRSRALHSLISWKVSLYGMRAMHAFSYRKEVEEMEARTLGPVQRLSHVSLL